MLLTHYTAKCLWTPTHHTPIQVCWKSHFKIMYPMLGYNGLHYSGKASNKILECICSKFLANYILWGQVLMLDEDGGGLLRPCSQSAFQFITKGLGQGSVQAAWVSPHQKCLFSAVFVQRRTVMCEQKKGLLHTVTTRLEYTQLSKVPLNAIVLALLFAKHPNSTFGRMSTNFGPYGKAWLDRSPHFFLAIKYNKFG